MAVTNTARMTSRVKVARIGRQCLRKREQQAQRPKSLKEEWRKGVVIWQRSAEEGCGAAAFVGSSYIRKYQ